jgi:hypothetical protein
MCQAGLTASSVRNWGVRGIGRHTFADRGYDFSRPLRERSSFASQTLGLINVALENTTIPVPLGTEMRCMELRLLSSDNANNREWRARAHGRTATSENHQLPACLARAASSLLMWSSTIL